MAVLERAEHVEARRMTIKRCEDVFDVSGTSAVLSEELLPPLIRPTQQILCPSVSRTSALLYKCCRSGLPCQKCMVIKVFLELVKQDCARSRTVRAAINQRIECFSILIDLPSLRLLYWLICIEWSAKLIELSILYSILFLLLVTS